MVNGPGNLPDLRKIQSVIPTAPVAHKVELKSAPKPEFKAQPAAEVTISPRAKELQAVLPKIQAVPEVRQDRVQEVKAKLSSVASPQAVNAKVAEKLLTGN